MILTNYWIGKIVRIKCTKKDLATIGISSDVQDRILAQTGMITKIWGDDNDKYNVRFKSFSNKGQDFCFEEYMLEEI